MPNEDDIRCPERFEERFDPREDVSEYDPELHGLTRPRRIETQVAKFTDPELVRRMEAVRTNRAALLRREE